MITRTLTTTNPAQAIEFEKNQLFQKSVLMWSSILPEFPDPYLITRINPGIVYVAGTKFIGPAVTKEELLTLLEDFETITICKSGMNWTAETILSDGKHIGAGENITVALGYLVLQLHKSGKL